MPADAWCLASPFEHNEEKAQVRPGALPLHQLGTHALVGGERAQEAEERLHEGGEAAALADVRCDLVQEG